MQVALPVDIDLDQACFGEMCASREQDTKQHILRQRSQIEAPFAFRIMQLGWRIEKQVLPCAVPVMSCSFGEAWGTDDVVAMLRG